MPKTVVDLRAQYKKETGYYPVKDDDKTINTELKFYSGKALADYIEWLEQVAITHLK